MRVDGVVTRRTGVYPQLQRTFYDCMRCSAVLGPYFQVGGGLYGGLGVQGKEQCTAGAVDGGPVVLGPYF